MVFFDGEDEEEDEDEEEETKDKALVIGDMIRDKNNSFSGGVSLRAS